jgi:cystathionine gamma-synthase
MKVMERVLGIPVVLYGNGSSEDLDKLEHDLNGTLHIDALYLEFPGNPLLKSPDLRRIWTLSRKFRFMVVLDDTVAAMSLDLTPYSDIICTSLTKMFSGACNVMGGSLILSPRSEHHAALHRTLEELYVDTYFPVDAVVMDKNSEDLPQRMEAAGRNAERVAVLLEQHAQVAEVFYPKGSASQCFYDEFKREDGGYGYLLSVRFVTPHAAHTFYDALDVAKGPSLGTNFTLCCAYTWLAHATEMNWAAEYGVVEDLVRISIGIEDWEQLERVFFHALASCSYSLL